MPGRVRLTVLGVVAGVAVSVGFAGGALDGRAAAATGRGDHPWTLRYFDRNGALDRVVHTHRSGAAPAPAVAAVGASPAMTAVHCDAGTDFRFHRDNPKQPVCYSGTGSEYIYVPYVYSVESDAWVGHYIANGTSHWIDPYTTDIYQTYQTVSYLGLANP